jgi:hypothetical protein
VPNLYAENLFFIFYLNDKFNCELTDTARAKYKNKKQLGTSYNPNLKSYNTVTHYFKDSEIIKFISRRIFDHVYIINPGVITY